MSNKRNDRKAIRREQAEARNALTKPERRRSARRPCPSGKRKLTEHEAQCELVGAQVDRNRGRNHRRERRAYLCPLCAAMHLTSERRGRMKQLKLPSLPYPKGEATA